MLETSPLLAPTSAGCEVLGESVPFGKALDNVDKINAYGYFLLGRSGLAGEMRPSPSTDLFTGASRTSSTTWSF